MVIHYEKYTIPVPFAVKTAVNKGHKLKDIGFKGQDLKITKQLTTHRTISINDLRSIRHYFARNIRVSFPDYSAWEKAGKPIDDPDWYKRHGILEWISYGGNAGLIWVNSPKIVNLLNDHFDKGYTKIQK